MGSDLTRSGITRFATNYLALHSLQDNKDAIILFFSGEAYLNGPWRKTNDGKEVYGIIYDLRFWEKVNGILQLLSPLYVVLRLVDGERRATLPFLYDAMQHALRKITAADVPGSAAMFKIATKRWEGMMNTDLVKAAHYLNPKLIYD